MGMILKRAENNGFNRKQAISEKLRAFLELPEGELVSKCTVPRAKPCPFFATWFFSPPKTDYGPNAARRFHNAEGAQDP